MKKVFMCLIVGLTACQDVLPGSSQKGNDDSLATRQYPHAFFVVEGVVTDSITQEAVADMALLFRWEDTVFTDENGAFYTQTVAYPTSQEFQLLINPYGACHVANYPCDTLSIPYLLPTFDLSREDVLRYGPQFFGSATYTLQYNIKPLIHE